jgi:hypothetical protein
MNQLFVSSLNEVLRFCLRAGPPAVLRWLFYRYLCPFDFTGSEPVDYWLTRMAGDLLPAIFAVPWTAFVDMWDPSFFWMGLPVW